MSTAARVEHFFRHEYGRMVSTLARRFGLAPLELIEDAAQAALMAALTHWPRTGEPDNPAAWLYRVAHNRVLDQLRQQAGHHRLHGAHAPELRPARQDPTDPALAGDVADDLLRMLFVCCDPVVPPASQLALALKILCGFSVPEIAHRLFVSEANVYKRLQRAKSALRERATLDGGLDLPALAARRPAVEGVLYQLFTEGYLSSHPGLAIRAELCDEALRLGHLLAAHPVGQGPSTYALLALMWLHRARLSARVNDAGELLLLEEQDRSAWSADAIAEGLAWLARSAAGDSFSRFHAEAAIAAEHCLAPSLAATRWDKIAELYALWDAVEPSPLHQLGRAVAVAEAEGPEAGLAALDGVGPPTWLEGSYLWQAVLADLHRRAGQLETARRHRAAAERAAPSDAVRALLARRFSAAG